RGGGGGGGLAGGGRGVRARGGGRGRRPPLGGRVGRRRAAGLAPALPRLAGGRPAPARRNRLARREPHVALAMPVEMVLALLGEELDRARVAIAGLERAADREIVELAVERGGLAAELARRVRVRVGHQAEAV